MHDNFESIPEWQTGESNTADKHGLEEGDVVSSAWGESTVVEVTDDGVRFDDGSCASHITVACNLSDVENNAA